MLDFIMNASGWTNRCPKNPGAAHGEDVAVVERFSTLPEIISLLPTGHAWRGMQPLDLFKSAFDRFIRIRPDLAESHSRWLHEQATDCPVIAVHYRLQSSHKVQESAEKRYVEIGEYFGAIDSLIARESAARIFLLTDYEPAVDAFRRRYASRVFCYDAARLTKDSVAEVQLGLTSPSGNHHLAQEVVRDIGTAALCQYFVLDGSSNVSVAIYCLAPAAEGRTTWLRAPAFGTIWTGERILPRIARPEPVHLISVL
ncbi:MAG: hypothetical protein FJX60_10025 [Alphaproteobacteria bacterium]|nr:hypothetical protein [Alphaproteobacteria bacterium]